MTSDPSAPVSKLRRPRSRARRHRLAGVGVYDALFRTGRRRDGRYLQLISVAAQLPIGRAGFVIGRKVLPLAVDRNRLRRLLRAALERARPAIDAHDVILRLMRGCSRDEIGTVAAEAEQLLARLVQRAAEGAGR